MNRKNITFSILLLAASQVSAFELQHTIGWHETIAAEWHHVESAHKYSVTISGENISNALVDDQLIRAYPQGWRVDIPGLKPGQYTVRVSALDINGDVLDEAESGPVTADSFIREGFGFANGVVPGAYTADGDLKPDARVLYITPENVNTVTFSIVTDSKGKETEGTGLCGILKNYVKGYEKRPLAIRFIGCIKDVTGLKSGKDIDLTGANFDSRATQNLTLEGVGNDATLYGCGIFVKRCKGVEIRNLGVMLFPNDGISVEYDNRNLWFHHCDFFYGQPGKDSDQKKGDGTIDMKYNSSDITVDHMHFFDSGKTTFAGGADESDAIYFTYHHNWFDHTDSRCPRLCHASTHIYNNYFDANPTMCLLSTENTSAFVESNYYRSCPSPMEINMQGTNRRRWPDGTQAGGMNKGYGNIYTGDYQLITQLDDPKDFDVYVVESPDERIPDTVKSLFGSNVYDNFDTSDKMYSYRADEAADVPALVTSDAGRMEGGDFKWTFDKPEDDKSTDINLPLKQALTDHKSSLISVGPTYIPGTVITKVPDIADSMSGNHDTVVYSFTGIRLGRLTDIKPLPSGTYILRSAAGVRRVIVP